jgi:hypothetical protein
MNEYLFYSSLIVGVLIIGISIELYNPKLLYIYIITYIGIITSIFNHGTSNTYIKGIDRIIMGISIIVYIYYCIQIHNSILKITTLLMIFLMIFMYFLSKIIRSEYADFSTILHITTHIFVGIIFSFIVINKQLEESIEHV